jgi:Family of unknown function (DUF5808)
MTGQSARAKGWRGWATFGGLLLVGAAIVRELRLPSEQRTWHGLLWGRIPYDLRLPDLGRIAHAMWDPENPRVLVPTAFGVGWTLNAGSIFGLIRAQRAR